MVAVAFAVVGLLLGARAVQMIVADDERYQAFAAEQGTVWPAPVAGQVRGSIISADGRELATSLEAARVVATPYQIEEPADGRAGARERDRPREGSGRRR
jgi:cell division protein FtsI/penicillin-binding protein 2